MKPILEICSRIWSIKTKSLKGHSHKELCRKKQKNYVRTKQIAGLSLVENHWTFICRITTKKTMHSDSSKNNPKKSLVSYWSKNNPRTRGLNVLEGGERPLPANYGTNWGGLVWQKRAGNSKSYFQILFPRRYLNFPLFKQDQSSVRRPRTGASLLCRYWLFFSFQISLSKAFAVTAAAPSRKKDAIF